MTRELKLADLIEPARIAAELAAVAPTGWQKIWLRMTVARAVSGSQVTAEGGSGRLPMPPSALDAGERLEGQLKVQLQDATEIIGLRLTVSQDRTFTVDLFLDTPENAYSYSSGQTRVMNKDALPSRVAPVRTPGPDLEVHPQAVADAVAEFQALLKLIEAGQPFVVTDDPKDEPIPASPLPAPATEEQIIATEVAIGRRLPADLRALYLIANGHTDMPAILGWTEMLPVQDIPREWERTREPVDWGGWSDWNWVSIDHQSFFRPDAVDAIAPVSGHPQWIPFARDGGGNNLLMDMAPGPGGVAGQIIEAGSDLTGGPEQVAPSLAALLNRMRRTGQVSPADDPMVRQPDQIAEPAWDSWISGLTPAWQEILHKATNGTMSRYGCAQVRALILNAERVTDLIPLVALTGLQELALQNVANQDLSILTNLAQLRKLFILSAITVTLPVLPGGLCDLQLRTAGVDLSALAGHRSLGTVSLASTEPTDLSPLAAVPMLEGLDASRCVIEDALDVLALRHLMYLKLSYQQWKRLESRLRELPTLAAATVSGEFEEAREVLGWFETGDHLSPVSSYRGTWTDATPAPQPASETQQELQGEYPSAEAPDGAVSPGELAFQARQRVWQEFGEVDTDVMTHVINPAFMGGPMWPDLRQAFIRSRGAQSTIVASDGLSDPFRDPANAIPHLSGLGLEVFIETDDPELAGEFSAIRESWAFVLAYEVAQNAAADGDFDLRLEKYGVLSMDFWGMDVPRAYGDGGRVGVLIGMPAPGITTAVDTGSGSATMLAVTVLTTAELNYILANGAAGRNHVAAALGAAGIHHRSPVSRASVI